MLSALNHQDEVYRMLGVADNTTDGSHIHWRDALKINISKWKPIQRIKNKYPSEPLPKDGEIWGIADIKDGVIGLLGNKGNTFNSIDFVITSEGKLVLGKKHHFLGNAQDVEAAGTLKLVKGKIRRITNDSGHYLPSINEAENFPTIFKQLNLDIKGATLEILYLDDANKFKTITKNIE